MKIEINKQGFEALLLKFHQGKCSKAEVQQILDSIPFFEGNPDVLYQRIESGLSEYPELETKMKRRIADRVFERIETLEGPQPKGRFRVWPGGPAFRWAAAIFLVFGLLGYRLWELSQVVVVETAYGEQKEFPLPDGSLVYLNAHSRIEYFKSWKAQDVRVVKLEGEAFFKVKEYPATGSKFRVETPGLNVEVLGTEFNVNSREGETNVYLEEGKVDIVLAKSRERVSMQPGDFVAFRAEGRILTKTREIDLTAKSWKSGVAEFSQTSLKEILEEVKEIYGVDFRIRQGLTIRNYTMSWPIDNLPVCLEIIQKTTGFDLVYLRETNQVIIE